MDIAILIFLSSGLFLGWSLGANDAANVFGTAVGTRMVKFGTAAAVCSLFVVLGAVISGSGAAHTLGKLGAVNAIAGSFMAASAAAMSVYWMTKAGLPVSTSQAIVGAIIGWNLFSGSSTDLHSLATIVSTWVLCPVLSGLIAMPIFLLTGKVLKVVKLHALRLDAYTRIALIVAGALGSYSLGANNIANVMGVFVDVSPFTDFRVADLFHFTSIQQLFLVGALAIAVGVFTYSKKVMLTVGSGVLPLSPVGAWVVVVAQSVVLFLFASEGLEYFLASHGLPTIPLVPVSSSQAVIGGVIGIGLVKGGRNIRWKLIGRIGIGWLATPIISGLLCFVLLYFVQNVFDQQVYRPTPYRLPAAATARLQDLGLDPARLAPLVGKEFGRETAFRAALGALADLDGDTRDRVSDLARVDPLRVDADRAVEGSNGWFSPGQVTALRRLDGRAFDYRWQLVDALATLSEDWRMLPAAKVNKLKNKKLRQQYDALYRAFSVPPQ
ncbi:MAG: inorganic phosphate transporter [Hyphomicrobiales bacterium]|nr:inorganic phosphate transporter [Hyphomicrobiales bacterium]MCP5371802.1 inorganic phosphate transporter [Hyphomicrobiales bacterium]